MAVESTLLLDSGAEDGVGSDRMCKAVASHCPECHSVSDTRWISLGYNHEKFPREQYDAITGRTTAMMTWHCTPSPDGHHRAIKALNQSYSQMVEGYSVSLRLRNDAIEDLTISGTPSGVPNL